MQASAESGAEGSPPAAMVPPAQLPQCRLWVMVQRVLLSLPFKHCVQVEMRDRVQVAEGSKQSKMGHPLQTTPSIQVRPARTCWGQAE